MATYRVTCVTTTDRYDHEKITAIGFANDNSTYSGTPAQVHDWIVSGDKFYVLYKNEEVWVKAYTANGHKYVRTEKTDTVRDNLLHQPTC